MAGENAQTRCSPSQLLSEKVTAAAAKTKGDIDVLSDAVVYYLNDAILGAEVAVAFEASRVIFPKTGSLVIAQFKRVYWNDNTKKVTLTNTDYAIGWCVRDAAGSDTTVMIRFLNEIESTTY